MNFNDGNRPDLRGEPASLGGASGRAVRARCRLGVSLVIVIGLAWTGVTLACLPGLFQQAWKIFLFLASEALYGLILAPWLWQAYCRSRSVSRPGRWLAGLIVLALLTVALVWGVLLPGNGWLPASATPSSGANQAVGPTPPGGAAQESLQLELPQAVFNALEGIQSDYIFDDDFTGSYFHAANATVAAGLVALTGSDGGEAFWSDDHPYARGQAALLLFTFAPDAVFTLGFTQYEGDSFWGIDQGTSLFSADGTGPPTRYDFQGDMKLEPGNWYYGLFTPAPEGGMLCYLWARDDPSRSAYSYDTTAYPADSWQFGLQVKGGTVWVDRYFGLLYDSLGSQFTPQNPAEVTPTG